MFKTLIRNVSFSKGVKQLDNSFTIIANSLYRIVDYGQIESPYKSLLVCEGIHHATKLIRNLTKDLKLKLNLV